MRIDTIIVNGQYNIVTHAQDDNYAGDPEYGVEIFL